MSQQAFDTQRAHNSRSDLDDHGERSDKSAASTSPSGDERSVVQARGVAPHWRVAELEQELARAQDALLHQREEFDQDAASFQQAIARLSHSERALGQAKARLSDADERFAKAEARIQELTLRLRETEAAKEQALRTGSAEQAAELEFAREALGRASAGLELQDAELSRLRDELRAANEATTRAQAQEAALRELAEALSQDSSAGTAECARLCDSLKAAEEREQTALAREQAANAARHALEQELAEARVREQGLTARAQELEGERDLALSRALDLEIALAGRYEQLITAQSELAHASADRSRLLGALGAVETLGREIAQLGLQARTQAEARPDEPSDDTDPERITLKPSAAAAAPRRSLRSTTSPEILIDGIPLEA
jgi:chromosome segregation ATPase